ncbi:DDE 3 domain-containing protein [Aphis craccivora]|uniref:DDE 3 domain-containing protein n=1 Tax=Aphis craccivora TaxID=307492 RepID=A0A6G0WBU7_APHCR|nr:DDE 3 domain-containing protein [Aphis craccivora]
MSKDIHSQTKKVIFSVYNYLKVLGTDKNNPEFINFYLSNEICAEGKKLGDDGHSTSFKSPRKSYKRIKYATNLDDFDNEVVRRTVHSFYDNHKFPTSSKILAAMREKTNYPGSKSSIKVLLKNLDFKYKNCNDGHKFLMERNDIVASRVKFLRKMNAFRCNNDSRPVVYLDETWVNQNHTRGYIWQNSDNTEGLKVPIGKGGRLIVCHAGSPSFGFVKNSKLVFRCKSSSSEDYHSQMNATVFEKWSIEMLGNLEEPCIIVMDNASYHSMLAEDYPKTNTRKADVQKWLQEKSIPFTPEETLCELRKKVKLSMPKRKKYKLDEIALQMGHEVVRLTPYHCQYNPIEIIWAQVKGEVAEKNHSFKIADVEVLVNNALNAVTKENWAKCGEHCAKIQDEDLVKEGIRDEILESIILTINPDDSSSDDDN